MLCTVRIVYSEVMRAAEIHEEPDGPEVVRFIIVHCSIVHDVVLWVDVCMWIGVCVCVCGCGCVGERNFSLACRWRGKPGRSSHVQ